MNDLLTYILSAAIPVAIGILYHLGLQLVQAKYGPAAVATLEQAAKIAVAAVEQQLAGKAPSEEKKSVATTMLKDIVSGLSYNYSDSNIHAAIEAAVLSLKQNQPIVMESATLQPAPYWPTFPTQASTVATPDASSSPIATTPVPAPLPAPEAGQAGPA